MILSTFITIDKMTHYPSLYTSKYTHMENITHLQIDDNIYQMLRKRGYVFPENLKNNIELMTGTFGLNDYRLDCVLNAFDSGELPPIKVNKDGVVVDGRHRLAASIIRGCSHIFIDYY